MGAGVQEQLLAGRHARDRPMVPAVHPGAHLRVRGRPRVTAEHKICEIYYELLLTSIRRMRLYGGTKAQSYALQT